MALRVYEIVQKALKHRQASERLIVAFKVWPPNQQLSIIGDILESTFLPGFLNQQPCEQGLFCMKLLVPLL